MNAQYCACTLDQLAGLAFSSSCMSHCCQVFIPFAPTHGRGTCNIPLLMYSHQRWPTQVSAHSSYIPDRAMACVGFGRKAEEPHCCLTETPERIPWCSVLSVKLRSQGILR